MRINKQIYTLVLIFFTAVCGIYPQQRPSTALPDNGMRPLEMKISKGGRHLIAAYESCTIVWDIEKREIIRRIPSNLTYNSSVRALNRDGSMLAVGDEQTLYIYNTADLKPANQFPIFEVAVDPNTYDSYGRGTLIGWHQEQFKNIYFSPDSKKVVVVSDTDRIIYADLVKNTVTPLSEKDPIDPGATIREILDIKTDSGQVVCRDNWSIFVFDFYSGMKKAEIRLEFNNMEFSPTSFSLADGSNNKYPVLLASEYKSFERYLLICDLENQKILNSIKIDISAHLIRLTNSENIAALALNGSIVLYDMGRKAEIGRLTAYEEPKAPILSPAEVKIAEPVRIQRCALQLGSFLSLQNAFDMVSNLEGEGFKASIERALVNNSVYWRVVINNVSENESTALRGILEDATFTDIWIRPPTGGLWR